MRKFIRNLFTKVLGPKSVDSLLTTFDRLSDDLNHAANAHRSVALQHDQQATELRFKALAARSEAQRAENVAQKIQNLTR